MKESSAKNLPSSPALASFDQVAALLLVPARSRHNMMERMFLLTIELQVDHHKSTCKAEAEAKRSRDEERFGSGTSMDPYVSAGVHRTHVQLSYRTQENLF